MQQSSKGECITLRFATHTNIMIDLLPVLVWANMSICVRAWSATYIPLVLCTARVTRLITLSTTNWYAFRVILVAVLILL